MATDTSESSDHLYSFRNEARQAAIDKRRNERDKEDETQEHFIAEFTKQKEVLDGLISSLAPSSKETLTTQFDDIAIKLNHLRKLISDSTIFLPSHTVRSSQQRVTELQLFVNKKEEELIPKQKFSFKSRLKKLAPAGTEKSQPPVEIKPDSRPLDEKGSNDEIKGPVSNAIEIKGKDHETITLQWEQINGSDVNMSDLSNCTVCILGSAGTLTISKCTNTKIRSGPVQRSIFIEECTNCSFVIACQQLRIHTSTKCLFYLHVVSRSIIEDSTNLQFAPYKWTYPGIEDHYTLSGLSCSVNNWDKVDDFNWLSTKEHSPNWSLLPEPQHNHDDTLD